MLELAKIVRERLKITSPAPEDHLDADLLTAFAEQSLPAPERHQVMTHLARCGDCREVVALALPAEAQMPSVLAHDARSGWLRWPVLGWAAALAAIILMGSVGILRYQARQPGSDISQLVSRDKAATVALNAPPTSTALQTTARQTMTPQAPTAPRAEMRENNRAHQAPTMGAAANTFAGSSPVLSQSRRPTHSNAANAIASAGRVPGIGYGSGAGFGPRSAQPASQNGEASTPAPQRWIATPGTVAKQNPGPANPRQNLPAAPSETVEVSAATPQIQTEQAQAGQTEQSQTELAQLDFDAAVGKAKPAAQAATPSAEEARANPSAVHALVTPVWTITAEGELQRSLDGGATWREVNVEGNSVPPASFSTQQETSRAKKSAPKASSAPSSATKTVFRAVCANGAETWAGGSGGALYHSIDAGGHWIRIVPSAAGVVLTGDIGAIEFADSQHGKVTTTSAETWTTGDGGNTWQKP